MTWGLTYFDQFIYIFIINRSYFAVVDLFVLHLVARRLFILQDFRILNKFVFNV